MDIEGNTSTGRFSLKRLRWGLANWAETVFGPDPGLLRLNQGIRTDVSAAMTLTILILVTGGTDRNAIGVIGLGFMTSIFSNSAVPSTNRVDEAKTLALLVFPALASVALSSFLSPRPWIGEIGFVLVISLAVLARRTGPRGTAMGMIAFISYFIGEIMRPPLTLMPELAMAAVTGIGAAALNRFLLFRVKPEAALKHVKWNIRRRVSNMLDRAKGWLPVGEGEMETEARHRRMNAEIARLDDAVMIARGQIENLRSENMAAKMCDALFDLELAAERFIRLSNSASGAVASASLQDRIARLQKFLRGDVKSLSSIPNRSNEPTEAALDQLEKALAKTLDVPVAREATPAEAALVR